MSDGLLEVPRPPPRTRYGGMRRQLLATLTSGQAIQIPLAGRSYRTVRAQLGNCAAQAGLSIHTVREADTLTAWVTEKPAPWPRDTKPDAGH